VRVRLLDGGSDAEAAPAALSGASVPALPADVVHAQACEPRVCGGATEQECGVDVDTAVRAACACASRPSFVRVGELRRRDPRSPLVRISVEDSGQGISACQLTRLFQPFAQAAQARNRRHGGCGLGLVISAAAARRLGGYVEAISQPRRGSVFSLCFPVELADAAPASAPSRPLAVAVLENEPLLREALVGMLRRLGAEPRVFGGVDELRAALRAEREALAYGSADELKGAAAPRPPLRLAVFGLDSPLFALRSWLADADGAAASPTGSPRGLAPSAALVADMEWIAGCGALPLVAVRHAGVPRSALLDACGDLLSGFVSFPLKQAQLAAWLARAAQLREAESACACEPAPVTPSSSSSSSQSSLSCAAVSSLSCEPASALSPPLAQPSRLGASFGVPESAAEGSAKTSSRLRVSARAISLQRQLVAGSLAPRPGAGAGLPAAPSDSASPTRPLRVLVVDDNPVNRKIIVSQLRRLGHEPVPAASGLAAIKLVGGGSGERTGAAEVDVDAGALLPLRAPRGAFDVVFTDLQMPDLDGYETATAIREAVRRAGQPQPAIVGCSASIGADVERLCRESGMDDTFAKPFTLESLAAKLASFGPLLKQRAAAPPDANEARAQELARA
jgi:CheY-like chemotaxis protein